MSRCQLEPGVRVGRLVVERRLPNSGRRSMWRCRCDCGKSHDILGERLTHPSKPTLSCGCLRVEAMMTNLHRMRAARNAQLARMREARLANLATAVKASTRKRDECRVREEREERERQAASLELARCLGYITGGDR